MAQPACRWPRVAGRLEFLLKGADEKRPGRTCEHFMLVAPTLAMLWPPAGGHFPFPREKGSEKGSWQSVAGVAREPDFLKSLVRSLVGSCLLYTSDAADE